MTNKNSEEATALRETLDDKFHRLVKKPEVATFLSVTTRTVEHMMADGRIPYIKLGRTVRFRLADILAHVRRE